ncbi:folate-dependent tRNA-U54 methylase TrmFO/GidA [Mucilaginibacter sp. UYNi724]
MAMKQNTLGKIWNDYVLWDKKFYEEIESKKIITEALNRFNPDNDVIVSRRELEALEALKSLAGLSAMVDQIAGVVTKVESISEGVDYIKSRYTKSSTDDLKKSDVKSDKVEDLTARLLKRNR